ncbi:cytochrome c oxidase subunit 2A [Chitinophaga sancti]
MNTNAHSDIEKNFKPRGTIAFIILLLLLTVLVWFSVYNLQLERH